MKTKRLGETLPVRIHPDIDSRLRLIASISGLTRSDVLRMAIRHGLPAIESGKLPLFGAITLPTPAK
jgi:predicted DNA-binding protein